MSSQAETPGQRLIAAFQEDVEQRGLQLDPQEAVYLEQAAAIVDRLAEVRRKIRRTGLLVVNEKSGAIKANPLLAVERMLQVDLARLVSRIHLEVPDAGQPELTPADLYRIRTKGHSARQRAQRARMSGEHS